MPSHYSDLEVFLWDSPAYAMLGVAFTFMLFAIYFSFDPDSE